MVQPMYTDVSICHHIELCLYHLLFLALMINLQFTIRTSGDHTCSIYKDSILDSGIHLHITIQFIVRYLVSILGCLIVTEPIRAVLVNTTRVDIPLRRAVRILQTTIEDIILWLL